METGGMKHEELLKANNKDIEWLLENATQYQITKETGVAQATLSNLKHGRRQVKNLTLEVASKLTEYANRLQSEE